MGVATCTVLWTILLRFLGPVHFVLRLHERSLKESLDTLVECTQTMQIFKLAAVQASLYLL